MKKSETIQTGLRISRDLRDKLQKAATRNGISLNSEMERRLVASFHEGERLAALMQHMEKLNLALVQNLDRENRGKK